MVRRFNWNAQAIPRCTAIRSDEPVTYALLERCKCSVHADVEFITRDCFELLFGIVYVIDVDRPDAEVGDAAFDLIAQEGWRDTVATCHEICRVDDARVEVFSLDIIAVLVLAGWRRCPERQVTALGSNEDRVSLWCDLAEGTPDHTFGELAPVVDRRIDVVDPELKRSLERTFVCGVLLVGWGSECRSYPESRESGRLRPRFCVWCGLHPAG